MSSNTINFERWKKLITKIQLIMVITIFVVEVVNNALLYISRSQGYGPDTIVEKLLRYLILTSFINFGSFAAAQIIVKKNAGNPTLEKYTLVFSTVVIVSDVACSHYQFTDTLTLFSVPLILTILYEDKTMCKITFFTSLIPLGLACTFRGFDSEYNKDIAPEAAIAFASTILAYIVARLCIENIHVTRQRLNEALIYEEEQKYTEILKKKNDELEELSREVIRAFAKAVDFNDPYTAGHSRRVGEYSREIAKRLGMSEEECKEVYYGGLLHDVGKLGIDNGIINKPDKLTDEEFEEIKKHPNMGYEILKDISIRESYAQGAKYHHERPDGRGYPDHQSDIPLVGRIISVADAYDAMTSKRSYRDALPQSAVREQIEKNIGTQFDEKIAAIMLEMIDEDKNYDLRQKD